MWPGDRIKEHYESERAIKLTSSIRAGNHLSLLYTRVKKNARAYAWQLKVKLLSWQQSKRRTASHRIRLSFANYKRKLFAATSSTAGNALDANGFADTFLNGFEFSL